MSIALFVGQCIYAAQNGVYDGLCAPERKNRKINFVSPLFLGLNVHTYRIIKKPQHKLQDARFRPLVL